MPPPARTMGDLSVTELITGALHDLRDLEKHLATVRGAEPGPITPTRAFFALIDGELSVALARMRESAQLLGVGSADVIAAEQRDPPTAHEVPQ